MFIPTKRSLILALGGIAALTACTGINGGTAPGGQAQLSLNAASRARSGMGASTASFEVTSPSPGTFTDGTNTLVLTSVQIVLRKIELERAGDAGACAAVSVGVNADIGADDSGQEGSTADGHADACEEVELGPVLFDVPVATAGAQHTVSVNIDAGTFEKVQFQIHKPEGSGDAAFLAANPGFAGVSIRVQGTWNGTAFTFASDLDAEQEIELSPPLVVSQTGTTDLTLFFDTSSWFKTSGGLLIDPASAAKGQPKEATVQGNIKGSLRAFRDNDEDGAED
jgi:hypothetical protein